MKWGDIVNYLDALNIKTSILFDDETLPAAHRIKHRVIEIHTLLEGLADLAKKVSDDRTIVDKIHQFYGEVLFNFLARFEENHSLLKNAINIPEKEIDESQSNKISSNAQDIIKDQKILAVQ